MHKAHSPCAHHHSHSGENTSTRPVASHHQNAPVARNQNWPGALSGADATRNSGARKGALSINAS